MFLGSNSVRRLNSSVFTHWPHLEYLTLENIIVEDVSTCLEIVGKQLKGLKIQCAGFDLMEVAERWVFFNRLHEFPLNHSKKTHYYFFQMSLFDILDNTERMPFSQFFYQSKARSFGF